MHFLKFLYIDGYLHIFFVFQFSNSHIWLHGCIQHCAQSFHLFFAYMFIYILKNFYFINIPIACGTNFENYYLFRGLTCLQFSWYGDCPFYSLLISRSSVRVYNHPVCKSAHTPLMFSLTSAHSQGVGYASGAGKLCKIFIISHFLHFKHLGKIQNNNGTFLHFM